ncbi:TPA: hypothetical protein ACPVZG_000583 [Vibrio parahaemolyticus]
MIGSSLSDEDRKAYIGLGIVCIILCLVALTCLIFKITELIFGVGGSYLISGGVALSILVCMIVASLPSNNQL